MEITVENTVNCKFEDLIYFSPNCCRVLHCRCESFGKRCPFINAKDASTLCKFYVLKGKWEIVSGRQETIKKGFDTKEDALQFICNHNLQNCYISSNPVDQ
jgi:hypothetical protein